MEEEHFDLILGNRVSNNTVGKSMSDDTVGKTMSNHTSVTSSEGLGLRVVSNLSLEGAWRRTHARLVQLQLRHVQQGVQLQHVQHGQQGRVHQPGRVRRGSGERRQRAHLGPMVCTAAVRIVRPDFTLEADCRVQSVWPVSSSMPPTTSARLVPLAPSSQRSS